MRPHHSEGSMSDAMRLTVFSGTATGTLVAQVPVNNSLPMIMRATPHTYTHTHMLTYTCMHAYTRPHTYTQAHQS